MYSRKSLLMVSLALFVVFMTLVAAGCSNSWFKKGGEKGLLRFQSGLEPVTLDPRKMKRVDELNIVQNIFSTLVMYDDDGRVVPCDAEKWEVSLDGRSYIFHLRRDAKWSNGDTVTAYDYEYAWQSAMEAKFDSPAVTQYFYIKNAEAYNKGKASIDEVGVDAIDDHTLSVNLERPTAYFLSLLTQVFYAPVHKKTAMSVPDWDKKARTIITNGPFTVVKWDVGKKIYMEKNPKFWGANKIKLNKAEAFFTEDVNKIIKMFDDNELDVAITVPDKEVERLIAGGRLVKDFPEICIVYYAFNTKKPPFDNQKVRLALALALDRKKMLKEVQTIGGTPALAFVPYGFCGIKNTEDFRKLGGDLFKDNDVQTAKSLLAEAGYADGVGFPKARLIYADSDWRRDLAEAVTAMWKKNLGIDVELVALDNNDVMLYRQRGEFDITSSRWVKDYMDPMAFIDVFSSGSNYNITYWKDTSYDAYVNIAKSTIDRNTRMQAMHDAEKILMEAMPVVPLYFTNKSYLVKPWVRGVSFYAGETGVDLWDVYIE